VVLQSEAVTDVDVSAAQMLEQLDRELNARGTHLAFAGLRGPLQDLVQRYGLYETIDRDRFYPTLEQGLEAIQSEGDGQAPSP
jgi:MFS superfamily sulfate permease-like transporter